MNEEGRVKRRSGQGSSTEGRRRAEPRGEQVFLAGENTACLRIIQPLPLPLLSHYGKKDASFKSAPSKISPRDPFEHREQATLLAAIHNRPIGICLLDNAPAFLRSPGTK
jgi:hypothetical protein